MNIEFFIQPVHQPDVDKDQNNENVNSTLLRKPESQAETAYLNLIQLIDEKDAEDKGNYKPDG